MVYNYLINQQVHYNNNIYDLFYFTEKLSKLSSPYCFIIHDKEKDVHFHALVLGCPFLKTEILDFWNTCNISVIDSVVGAFEYLTHKNDLEKNQYEESSIIYSCCSKDFIINYGKLCNNRKKSKDYILSELIDNIINHNFTCLRDCFNFDNVLTFKNYFVIRELLERYNFIEMEGLD